jgi:PhoPQ-activated pathogenicity-related protein
VGKRALDLNHRLVLYYSVHICANSKSQSLSPNARQFRKTVKRRIQRRAVDHTDFLSILLALNRRDAPPERKKHFDH